MTGPDAWKTPELLEAEARLAEAEAGLDRAIADAKRVGERVPDTALSRDDIEQIERFAKGPDAPDALRKLQERIDKGDLSWEDIASGRKFDDPQVRDALSGNMPDLHRAYEQLRDGEHIDDVIASGQSGPKNTSHFDDADADGEGGTGFLKRDW